MSLSPITATPLTSAGDATSSSNSTAGADTSQSAASSSSISSLTPTDFIQMLATELENQDPSNPTDPSEILQQTSTIANMESMTNMSSSVQDEQAAGLIGLTVTGVNTAGSPVSGTVSDVQLDPTSGAPNLLVDGVAVPLASVTDISQAQGNSGSASSASTGTSS